MKENKFNRATRLIYPSDPAILVSPTASRTKTTSPGSTESVRYTSSVWLPNMPETSRLLVQKNVPPLRLYGCIENNTVILCRSADPDAIKIKLQLHFGKHSRGKFIIRSSTLPPPSYSTCIRDFIIHKTFIILRWPVLLYANPIRTADDRRRTINRQRRESELIEASYAPIRERPPTHPFFVPALTLDPFWSPADSAANREWETERGAPPLPTDTGE